jgi:hypothetical protein
MSWSRGKNTSELCLVLIVQLDSGKWNALWTPHPPQNWERLDLAVFAFFLLCH